MKTRTLTLSILPTLLVALPASAAETCAEDDWFCASEEAESSTSDEPVAQPGHEPAGAPAAPTETPPSPVVIDSRSETDRAAPRTTRPRVIYTSSASSSSVVGEDEFSTSKSKKDRERLRHFGFNLRLSSLLQERDRYMHSDAGLTGFGVGFRFIPVSFLTLEPGIDGFAGHDYYGRERTETTLSFNSIFTLNPNDPIQVYGLVGVFTTTAETKGIDPGPIVRSNPGRYSYVGAQIGAGIELRLDPALGFHADVIGYTRQRNELPQVHESTADLRRDGGGGLFRAGMSLYF
jgi:hypothetical protein